MSQKNIFAFFFKYQIQYYQPMNEIQAICILFSIIYKYNSCVEWVNWEYPRPSRISAVATFFAVTVLNLRYTAKISS